MVGTGETINMSSGGILFRTESDLNEGDQVELVVDWPAKIDGAVRLKLVAFGPVVRIEQSRAAIVIKRYEFKIRASGDL